jgi:hypothetical protein
VILLTELSSVQKSVVMGVAPKSWAFFLFRSFVLTQKNQKVKSEARRFWAKGLISNKLPCRVLKPESA